MNHYSLSQWKLFFTSLIHLRLSLTTLVVHTGSSEQTEGILDRDTLKPLLDLSNLVVLKIYPTTGFDLDNEALRELSAAWPWLRELELIDSQVGVQPRITLPGIVRVVLNCPHLEDLAITFDASAVGYLPESSSDNCNKKLKPLKVGRSPIKDFVNVAAFLLDLAPNLTTIKMSNDHHPDMIEKWGHVARLLQTFGKRRVPVVQAL
ncbi:hypothetical protein Hypma_016478 [Hypsizygus marmoreus]|uniref:Uncharacterized protein n=1 Tax=Hypsizygus marmoreus TaxID=39966 RepID=A0A369J2Y0_HYPMA|nr:hypothetical protein Hypma_016478 [Hypsizygus marmoreus]